MKSATAYDQSMVDLIGQIYESAAEASEPLWLDTYNRISNLLSSGPGSLSVFHKSSGVFESIADTQERGFFEKVNSVYAPIMPFLDDVTALRTGEYFVRRRDCPDDIYLESELYQDHFRKLGFHWIVYHRLFENEHVSAGISFTRPMTMAHFDQPEFDVLARLSPHLQRGLALHFKTSNARNQNQIMYEAWERMQQGVVVISQSGRIVFKNGAADQLFSAPGGLQLDRNGSLGCDLPRDDRSLKELICGVFAPQPGRKSSFGGAMRLSRGSEKPPLSVLTAPFSERGCVTSGSERLALVMITDPATMSDSLSSNLRQIYGFTRAEARFAVLLAEGLSLKEAGEQLQVAQNTVRTHLKRLFSKTDTNRQGSLVKLILSLPAIR